MNPERGRWHAHRPVTAAMTTDLSESPSPLPAPTRLLRGWVLSIVLASIVLTLMLAGPVLLLGGADSLLPMMVGLGCAIAAGLLAMLPLFFFVSGEPQQFLGGLMLSIGVRFFLALSLALIIFASEVVPVRATLLWLAGGHLALMLAESMAFMRVAARLPKGSAGSSQNAAGVGIGHELEGVAK